MEHVTLLRPDARPPSARGISSALPPDLLEQVRGRVRLLAMFILVASAFDPTLYFVAWGLGKLLHKPLDADVYDALLFQWINLGMVAASYALWRLAGSKRVSASRLLTIGLVYEVVICFVIATTTYWQTYLGTKVLPNLTWVAPIVILFPLIMPGPPRTMLVAAIAAGAMAPLGLLVLDLTGKVSGTGDAYPPAVVSSAFAVWFAYLGAKIIYGLGREVAAAREMGSYRLEEKLGQGGMGEVWRAKHRLLARPAAIKVIRPQLADGVRPAAAEEGLRRRFEREAQVTASLRSPHTVGLYDFGVADDGSFYYVMELLDGLDADTLVKRFGPMPAERVVHVLKQVCHSLSEADSRGLVHRDIKPANIFLCRYGEEHDFVKVLDFGLVKALGDGTDSDGGEDSPTALTRENAIHGTPAFIAPEQALGKSKLDGRVDLYATGCVAYWLLTGQAVFSADTPMGLLMQHVHERPAAPSTRTEMQIPAALDRVVLDCLAKDPKDRPQSAKELVRRLGELEGDGAARWTEERAKEWWGKQRPAA